MKTIRFVLNRIRHSRLDLIIRILYITICQVLGFVLTHFFLINSRKVVFESFSGKSLCDSPLALLSEMDRVKSGWEFVIVYKDGSEKLEGLSGNNIISYTKFRSVNYYISYFTSKLIIVNCRLPYILYKKKSQLLLQTWHGVPLKKIGMDIELDNNPIASIWAIHLAYLLEGWRSDYFLSSSNYLSEKLSSAFGIDDKKIIQHGLPRNDALLRLKSRIDLKDVLNIPKDKKIILYAPTYRDTQFGNGEFISRNILDCDLFCSKLSSEYVFLFRGHYFSNSIGSKKYFLDVSHIGDINELLLITDTLITDYSSVMFDFSILNRNIYFFHPDYKEYSEETRGMYFDVRKECPDIHADSIDELLFLINNNVKDENYLIWKDKFMSFNDDKTSERVVEKLLSQCE